MQSKKDVVKKDVYNAKIKYIEDKIPNITNLATSTTLNAKINKVENEIPDHSKYITTPGLSQQQKIKLVIIKKILLQY